jgi:hypothetical protein
VSPQHITVSEKWRRIISNHEESNAKHA